MKYVSTRDNTRFVSGAEAIARGQASDGGLYVPESIPQISLDDFEKLRKLSYAELAFMITKLYLPEFTDAEIYEYTKASYGENFDTPDVAPVRVLSNEISVLELWHGPTCAFKDMALQYLPRLMTASLKNIGETNQVCILVATSGDTGKAALEGFRDVAGTRITVFYPRDGVSDIQKLQMRTQDGNNVDVCSVNGNFDDAQSGVKKIFSDATLKDDLEKKGFKLSSANSINWGRLMPQIVYYIYAYSQLVNGGTITFGDKINFCVPTGNFGNILAGYIAKVMGLPINKLICASNENKVLTDFISTGTYDRKRELVLTASPSMDILISSNLERLLYLISNRDAELVKGCMQELNTKGKYSIEGALLAKIQAEFVGGFCNDPNTKETIKEVFEKHNYLIDTHTAVAYNVLQHCEVEGYTVVISTASPYKFCKDVIEALGGQCPDGLAQFETLSKLTGTNIPKPLAELSGKQARFSNTVETQDMREYVWHSMQ